MMIKNHCSKIKKDSLRIFVFGATGDLAHKKLFPSLFNLYKNMRLNEDIEIVAIGRKDFSDSSFNNTLHSYIVKSLGGLVKDEDLQSFFSRVKYLNVDFQNLEDIKKLKIISDSECMSQIFYLAVPPSFYKIISKNLEIVGLNKQCLDHNSFSRIVLEKPFGTDLKSAEDLNRVLLAGFSEKQIYRIDHYLGKEPVQNIFSFRFANNIFENIWSNKYIDSIQIQLLEDIGIEKRGAFYDATGVIIDVFQNHILQMLAILTMNKPKVFKEENIRYEKNSLISRISVTDIVKGQYEGYKEEQDVDPQSKRDTFVAMKIQISSRRWKGVPIYIKTGKMLDMKKTIISVVFKNTKKELFGGQFKGDILSFIIQPDLGIKLNFAGKVPGMDYQIADIQMEYKYSDYFGELKSEYEKLLTDCILGNQMNFTRTDEIENSWRIVDKIENNVKDKQPLLYTKKSGGPKEAHDLINNDNRSWIL
ncbi:MAG: glucose-6-phosphate dehydrogenase [Patescibacteria group bacterium]